MIVVADGGLVDKQEQDLVSVFALVAHAAVAPTLSEPSTTIGLTVTCQSMLINVDDTF